MKIAFQTIATELYKQPEIRIKRAPNLKITKKPY